MDAKSLLKKKGWTGEEAGKAGILSLIHAYEQVLSGNYNGKPLFTADHISNMVKGFAGSRYDLDMYGRYLNLQSWIRQYQAVANAYFQLFQASLNEYISIGTSAEMAENEFRHIERLPRILTQQQYDELKARRVEETIAPDGENASDTLFGLVIRAMEYYASELERYPKKNNPLKAVKKLYGSMPVDNATFRRAYAENTASTAIINTHNRIQNKKKSPEQLCKWDIIKDFALCDRASLYDHVSSFFGDGAHTHEEATAQVQAFKKEFPEAVEATIKELESLEYAWETDGGETRTLSSATDEEWATISFTWRMLYETEFPGFREWVESDFNIFSGDKRALCNGIAIVRPSDLLSSPHNGRYCLSIDAEGRYIEPAGDKNISLLFGLDRFTAANPECGDEIIRIEKLRASIEDSLRWILGYDAALKIVADGIGIPSFTIFAVGDKRCLERVTAVNDLFDDLYSTIDKIEYQDEERKAAKLQALRDVFPHLKTDELAVSEGRIAEAKKMIAGLDAFSDGQAKNNEGLDFLAVLTTPEGGGDE